jgi:hypothetical protein
VTESEDKIIIGLCLIAILAARTRPCCCSTSSLKLFFQTAMSRFLFAFEYINVVKAWTTFGRMFCKPEQVTMSFPFVRCDKALDALQCLKNLEPPQMPEIRQYPQCQPGMVLPSSSMKVLRVMPGQSQMESRSRGGSILYY